MKRELTDRLGHWLDCLLGSYSDKIKIIANVLVHDWRMSLPMYSYDQTLASVTEDEIEDLFSGLDKESIGTISAYISVQKINTVNSKYGNLCFFNYEKLFNQEEKKLRQTFRKQFLKLKKRCLFPGVGPESLLFHHGLLFFPEKAIRYLAGGNFVDAGACYGDSSLIFSRFYRPAKIYAFEPSEKNRRIMQKMLNQYLVSEQCYNISPYGLGEKPEQLFFCNQESPSFGISTEKDKAGITVQIIPLDKYIAENKLSNIRLIKADLEGMGLAMLKGAEQTIRKNRPVLSLSIYHNREELLDIYRTLRSWDLNYEFTIRSTAFPLAFSEIVLLGYPAELNPAGEKWKTDEAMFNHLSESAEILLKN